MNDMLEKPEVKANKHRLIACIILCIGLFDIMQIMFCVAILVLGNYKFSIYNYLINIMITSALGLLGGIYLWMRDIKRYNQVIPVVFFIIGIVLMGSKSIIGAYTGLNIATINPFNATITALDSLGFLFVIDILFRKFMPKYLKRIANKN